MSLFVVVVVVVVVVVCESVALGRLVVSVRRLSGAGRQTRGMSITGNSVQVTLNSFLSASLVVVVFVVVYVLENDDSVCAKQRGHSTVA